MNLLNKRANGVLMHISSLPGETGIGTLGKNAYAFVDFLKKSDQTYWQVLPIGPTGYGDSPYQSFSIFAGNPYFIDFELLEKEELIEKEDYADIKWCSSEERVDYGILYTERHSLFTKIHANFKKSIPNAFGSFCKDNAFWLDDYSLFMAVKDAHNGETFSNWEEDIRKKQPEAVKAWTEKCADKIDYYKMLQFLFYKQWNALKKYANEKGIRIIGDIPIYVSADSCDVWSSPEQFVLDSQTSKPIEVAGCPPDAFSADGQLWGNPVYNWDFMKKDNYTWWKKRLEMSLKIFDVLRIDHFRGFDSYYCIPFGDKTAQNGVWRKGPGADLFKEIQKTYGELSIIAEDLGFLTDSVRQMLAEVGYPGMKVLQFAFDSREDSEYFPYSYKRNTVVYTGTHDNDTICGWMKSAPAKDVATAKEYLRATDENFPQEMMLTAMESVSNTCILCMQDLLGLDGSARMNKPSSVGTNWQWRAKADFMKDDISAFLSKYTKMYRRV